MPLFSIILTTYNRADIISRAIDSVIEQIFDDWELIIWDDGSFDDTTEKVKLYFNDKIKYFRNENSGVAVSRNLASKNASGEFLTFLDSDDYYKPDHLSIRAKLISKTKAKVLHGGFEVIGDPFVPDKNDRSRKIHLDRCVIDGTLFIKRDIFMKIGGFPLVEYSPGNALVQKLIEQNISIISIDESTYIYNRTSEDSICNNISEPLRKITSK